MSDPVSCDEFRKHERSDDKRFGDLFELQRQNAEAITLLTKNTKDIIQLHKDLRGAVRIGTTIQHFGIWLMKWPVIGLGLYTAWNWLINHLPTG